MYKLLVSLFSLQDSRLVHLGESDKMVWKKCKLKRREKRLSHYCFGLRPKNLVELQLYLSSYFAGRVSFCVNVEIPFAG
jgi:hypothetical protein